MTTKIFCNKCNKELKRFSDMKILVSPNTPLNILRERLFDFTDPVTLEFDLCDKCRLDFDKVVANFLELKGTKK